MPGSILIFKDSEPTNIFNHQPSYSSNTDWFDKQLSFEVDFYLAKSQKYLTFAAVVKNYLYSAPANCQSGIFKSELWKSDVLELFIADTKTENYLEINLSPSAEWWFATFNKYRESSNSQSVPLDIKAESKTEENTFSCSISFLTEELPAFVSELSTNTFNFCCILGDNPRNYLASNSESDKKPDFHNTKNYISLSQRIIL
ncbi:MAG: hypothetical protein KBC84_01135 [Proteobacteria bacterium]|nr:hypothetical protein [Pseudomonadota bacterium]